MHALQGDAKWQSIPVIVITGAGDSILLRRAEHYHLFRTFFKGSFDVRGLVDTVDEAVRGVA